MPSESDKWGWKHVTVFGRFDKGSGTKKWKCHHCNLRYNGSCSRVRAHLLGSPPIKRIRTLRPSLCVTKEDIDEIAAIFFYIHGLNVNVINSPYIHDRAKTIAPFGPGYEPLSIDELFDPFLIREKGRIEKSLALLRESCPHTGCTILCFGLMFLKAVDIGDTVMEVGPSNVLKIISHLGNAGKLSDSIMLSKFPHIFWSPCTSTLYMQVQSKSEGSFGPLSAKFSPSFCIVQRIFELKKPRQELVVSERWKQWKINIPDEISSVEATILGDDFWSNAHLLFEPFALDAVKSKDVDNGTLSQLEELIENRRDALFSPLHAAGYILNPRYFGRGQTRDKTVMRGWKATLDRYEYESADRRIWQEYEFPCQETASRFGVDIVEHLVFVRNNLRLNSQRNGITNSLSVPKNVSLCSSSGAKTWEGAHKGDCE
ncbi:hypothetical protein PRUPE_I001200 [Prunus persica]|uniref:BED-type domain-containing protein n=1 Tax=Prunus persica TaxID=3760 RepID=A0A1R3L4Y2_PRUPE|nr:hypothetical protein PRUPE_I001200 [Prunus persica]